MVLSYTLQMAEFLLEHGGAKVNAVTRFGEVPLQECIRNFNLDAIKLLIK